MLFNTLKLALRNLQKHKFFSFINILGLSMGLAAVTLIFFYVRYELSFDKFHKNVQNIYRVERAWNFKEMQGQAPIAAAPWGPELVAEYPEIQKSVRIYKEETFVRNQENMFFKQNLIAADPTLFEIFDFSLIEGDPRQALDEPYQLILTRDLAKKYCGDTQAIGQSLVLNWLGNPTSFEVVGILSPVPGNSQIHFDMVVSFASYPDSYVNDWIGGGFYNYIQIVENADYQELESKFPAFLQKHAHADFTKYFGPDSDVSEVFQIKLRPMRSIHLDPSKHFEFEPQGNWATVRMFMIAAWMILGIAAFNFINLSTVQAHKRAREVGTRKTVGATKRHLIIQYLTETMNLAIIAMVVAMLIVQISIPALNGIFKNSLVTDMFGSSQYWIVLLALTGITGLLAGLYPAFFLSRLQPMSTLKSSQYAGLRKSHFRTSLTIIQFAISIILIISTLIANKQVDYIQNKALGFDKENVIILPAQSKTVRSELEAFRTRLLQEPQIQSVAGVSFVPGPKTPSDSNFKRADNDDIYNLLFLQTDYSFVETFNFQLIHGRTFSKSYGTDKNAFILSEKAVADIGYQPEEAVGKTMTMIVDGIHDKKGSIIGVVKDFHFMSLHSRMQPYVFSLPELEEINYIAVRIARGTMTQSIDLIKSHWRALYPNEQFEYTFLDERINQLYQKDKQTRILFTIFSGLAIFIACLGLFALAAFSMRQRSKEISIRKIVGSSVQGIAVLLIKDFVLWIGLSNLLAWPLAWLAMHKWLENFAYRIDLTLWPFLLSGLMALSIALLTISWQAVRAATANPVESLRYE